MTDRPFCGTDGSDGVTVREWLAGVCLQGLIAAGHADTVSPVLLAGQALALADALCERMARDRQSQGD